MRTKQVNVALKAAIPENLSLRMPPGHRDQVSLKRLTVRCNVKKM